MGKGRRRLKKTPEEQKQEQEQLTVTPEPELRRKKATPWKRAVGEVYEEQPQELLNMPQPEVRRSRGRPRKRAYMPEPDDKPQPVLTTTSEDHAVGEVCVDSAPNLEITFDIYQPVAEANMPTNVKGYTEKEAGRQSDAHLSKSGSFDLTQIVEQMGCDFIDADELGSRQDETRVSVCGYAVKAEVAPILTQIFSQFGDLVKDCIFPSITSRARLLESICTIYQRLEALSFMDIKPQELNLMLEEVNDLEISKVKVGWLRKRLGDISGARQAFEKKQRNVLATQKRRKALEECNKELEGHKKELECCKEKLKAVEGKITEEEKALAVEEAEGKQISEMFSEVKSTLKALCQIPSLAHGLLGSL